MNLLDNNFTTDFTSFKEFQDSVEKIINEKASEEKRKVLNENWEVTQHSNISFDFANRIYLHLETGENIKSIFYLDSQIVQHNYFSESNPLPDDVNRYHLYKCPTVDLILSQNLKFSVTARQDNYFKYYLFNNIGGLVYETNHQQLLVCQSCLNEFNLTHGTNYTNYTFLPLMYLSRE